MMKHEFVERVNEFRMERYPDSYVEMQDISAEDYAIVEFVYTWHPSIPAVGGKNTIAALYVLGGMCLIMDMVGTAKHAEQRDAEIRSIRAKAEACLCSLGELTGKKYAISEV